MWNWTQSRVQSSKRGVNGLTANANVHFLSAKLHFLGWIWTRFAHHASMRNCWQRSFRKNCLQFVLSPKRKIQFQKDRTANHEDVLWNSNERNLNLFSCKTHSTSLIKQQLGLFAAIMHEKQWINTILVCTGFRIPFFFNFPCDSAVCRLASHCNLQIRIKNNLEQVSFCLCVLYPGPRFTLWPVINLQMVISEFKSYAWGLTTSNEFTSTMQLFQLKIQKERHSTNHINSPRVWL